MYIKPVEPLCLYGKKNKKKTFYMVTCPYVVKNLLIGVYFLSINRFSINRFIFWGINFIPFLTVHIVQVVLLTIICVLLSPKSEECQRVLVKSERLCYIR